MPNIGWKQIAQAIRNELGICISKREAINIRKALQPETVEIREKEDGGEDDGKQIKRILSVSSR